MRYEIEFVPSFAKIACGIGGVRANEEPAAIRQRNRSVIAATLQGDVYVISLRGEANRGLARSKRGQDNN
jgi:hypothetical protein